jgi:hypothetical protein
VEWIVCIKGDEFDLQELSKSLTSPELCLIKEENEYYLKSTSFNQLNNAGEVKSKAEEILSLINGASKLALGTRKPLIIDSVIKITDDDKRQRNFFESVEVTEQSMFTATVDGAEVHQAEPIPDWIKIAQSNENVAKVLRLLSKGDYDWVNLYRIFEVIEEDVGAISKITQEAWATEPAIRRFKHTANSVGAIGDDARHGKETTQPPKNPMTFSEAKSFIETILHNWLRSKI